MTSPANIFGKVLDLQRRFSPTGRGSFALARRARSKTPVDQWKGHFTTPQGFKLELDLNTYPDVAMAYGVYELETARLIQKLLKPGNWFVDCGANIGYFTLLADRCVGPTGRVDAFEPDPFNRARLEQHLKENNSAATHVHPCAVAAMNTSVRLYRATGGEANHGMSSLYSIHAEAELSFQVETARLDERLNGVPDLIKIDIEGSELAAIEGASGILKSPWPPALIIEHNPQSSEAAQFAPGDLFDLLKSIQPGYDVYWIGWRLKRIHSAKELNKTPRQGNLFVQKKESK